MKLTVDGHEFEVDGGADSNNIRVNRAGYGVRIERDGDGAAVFVDNRRFAVRVEAGEGGAVSVVVDGRRRTVGVASPREPRAVPAPLSPVAGGICTPLAGRVAKVLAEVGATVRSGDALLTVEAMKLENEIRSPLDGVVKELRVSAGDRVAAGELLAVVE